LSKDLLSNSGAWLLHSPEFDIWRKSSASSILWLHGIPGSGKTRLVARTIEYLQGEIAPQSTAAPIAYFYCARDSAEPERANPDEIMRSILKQVSGSKSDQSICPPILKMYQGRLREAEEDGSEITRLNIDECVALILSVAEETPMTIIIDALDECDPQRRHELLKSLKDLINESASLIKIFVSSRDDGDIVLRLNDVPNIYIHAKDNSQDIERFVYQEVDRAIQDHRLLYGNVPPELKSKIISTLVDGASGMFVRYAVGSFRLTCQ
jgi:hypothetical protein